MARAEEISIVGERRRVLDVLRGGFVLIESVLVNQGTVAQITWQVDEQPGKVLLIVRRDSSKWGHQDWHDAPSTVFYNLAAKWREQQLYASRRPFPTSRSPSRSALSLI